MNREDAEEYTQSLGQIMAGGWRQILWAQQQGIPEALGLATADWVVQRIGGYVRLELPERRAAAKELEAEGLTQREIGEVLGVSQKTVDRDLDPESFDSPAPELCVSLYGDPESFDSPAPELPKTTRELLAQSDQNDWRTPRKFLDAARSVLGTIDLDPASSAEANETVMAARFYTEAEDGLKLPWKGRLWLNPPYGGNARLFVERLVKEYEVGNVVAACTLVNSHPTETQWFQQLFRYAVCFVKGRIDFGGPSREVSSSSTHGSAIAYLGPDVPGFAAVFAEFGSVVVRA